MILVITNDVESSNVLDLAYDADSRILTVTFKAKDGKLNAYEYRDLPYQEATLMLVPGQSVGVYLNQLVKPYHAYRKQGAAEWQEPKAKKEVVTEG